MLKLDLAELQRESSLRGHGAIAADDPLWKETHLRFVAPLDVNLRAEALHGGDVLVRASLRGDVTQSCTRCLVTVNVPVVEDVTILFGPVDEANPENDGDVRPIDPGAVLLDLAPAIREELVLSIPAYAVCSQACKGLCPRCGVDLNVETCQCVTGEADPRWDALRALKTD